MDLAGAAKLGSRKWYRKMISPTKYCILLTVAFSLTGCGVRRLEDIMGPGPTLAQPQLIAPPPANLSLAVPPADVFAPPTADDTANEINPSTETKSEVLTPIMKVQENRNSFTSEKQWVGFSVDNGIDATNAEGTTCSGRTNGDRDLAIGKKIMMACSDGKWAVLEIRQLVADGATGMMMIDKAPETAVISRSELPIQ